MCVCVCVCVCGGGGGGGGGGGEMAFITAFLLAIYAVKMDLEHLSAGHPLPHHMKSPAAIIMYP